MTEGDAVLGRRLRVEIADLDRWCRTHLGGGVDKVPFRDGYLSTVLGVELTGGSRAVVKIRTRADRLHGCAAVHRQLFARGFPCPELLVDLQPFGDFVASAEAMSVGGHLFPSPGRLPVPFAAALARLVQLAPAPAEIQSLGPRPPWTAPPSGLAELWPDPDDRDVDLNAATGPAWLDEAALVARAGLARPTSPPLVGHGDWYTGNLRWTGDDLHAVWDWDSAIAASEAVIAGLAAAIYPATSLGTAATVEETEAFLEAYQEARTRTFGEDELVEAWAAGLWSRAFDAKKEFATQGAVVSLSESEALERRRRAVQP